MLIYKVRALLYQSAPLVIPFSNHHRVHTCLGKLLVWGGLRIHHSPVVGRIGRRQVVEEGVVGRPVDPCLLPTVPVVVVGIRGHDGAVVEVGRKHPGVIQDQLHHGFRLRLATSEESCPCEVFLTPRREVSVQVLRAFVVATSFVVATLMIR